MSYLTANEPFRFKVMTLKEFAALVRGGKIDLHPCFQRGVVATDKWSRGVVGSLFSHELPIEIHLRDMGNGRYQSIDGTQRMTALSQFVMNKLHTPNMVFYLHGRAIHLPSLRLSDIQELANMDGVTILKDGNLIYQHVMETKIMCVVYDKSMTDEEAAIVFGKKNDGCPLNHQEKRNSIIGGVSSLVRRLARGGDDTRHPLADELPESNRMGRDEFFAFALYYEYQHQTTSGRSRGYANRKTVDGFYQEDNYRYHSGKLQPIGEGCIRRAHKVAKVLRAIKLEHRIDKKKINPITMALYQLSYVMPSSFFRSPKVVAALFYTAFSNLMKSKRVYRVEFKKNGEPQSVNQLFREFISSYSPVEVCLKLGILKREMERLATKKG